MKKLLISFCMASFVLFMTSCRTTKNTMSVASINGEWNIIELNGSVLVPTPNQEFPFIGFDVASGHSYGNSSCNRMMGSFVMNGKPGEIHFINVGTTRMACPNMTTEQSILAALGKIGRAHV